MEILEAVSSLVGNFELRDFHRVLPYVRILDVPTAIRSATSLLECFYNLALPIHPSLALASLARPALSISEQRTSGAYYTDFRLAQFLANQVTGDVTQTVLDPASGTGILLVALGLHLSRGTKDALDRFVAQSVHAADLSAVALRGTALALASLTSNLDAIEAMTSRLYKQDSLLTSTEQSRSNLLSNFQVVIGNPPWEKLKITRHEFLLSKGIERHYGAAYDKHNDEEVVQARHNLNQYINNIKQTYRFQGDAEIDLYRAFLELGLNITADGGQIALLLPAGLIRSKGTEELRRHLLANAHTVALSVLENKARFFAIDTRFKFLTLHLQLDHAKQCNFVTLRHAKGEAKSVETTSSVSIGLDDLAIARRGLSIPEVRSDVEWQMFQKMCRNGAPLSDTGAGWQARIFREIDMTRDRSSFISPTSPDAVPVIEGRMVQQYHFGAKSYMEGSGRRSTWVARAFGFEDLQPQFWISSRALREAVNHHISRERIGFCDIAGQTNERSMMAAKVPAHVVCGNKVPTVAFGESNEFASDLRANFFLAVANSLPFDWLLRRVLTTTINFFILMELPLPHLSSVVVTHVAKLADKLTQTGRSRVVDPWSRALLRAEIDSEVALLYGLDHTDLGIIMNDFPLLDRGQPSLPGEPISTVTKDLLLTVASKRFGSLDKERDGRLASARRLGAIPYIPAEHAATYQEVTAEGNYVQI